MISRALRELCTSRTEVRDLYAHRTFRDARVMRAAAAVVLVIAAVGCKKDHETVPAAPVAVPTPTQDGGGGQLGSNVTPEVVTNKSDAKTHTGFLYKPDGAGPFPAFVFFFG